MRLYHKKEQKFYTHMIYQKILLYSANDLLAISFITCNEVRSLFH